MICAGRPSWFRMAGLRSSLSTDGKNDAMSRRVTKWPPAARIADAATAAVRVDLPGRKP